MSAFNANPLPPYRYFRYVGPSGSQGWISEIQFTGVHQANPTSTTGVCPVSVAVNTGIPTVGTPTYQYDPSLTAMVTSFTPSTGTAAGSTVVNVQGSLFGTDVSAVSVLIDGAECVVSTVTDSNIECTTSPRPLTSTLSMAITINGEQAAIVPSATFTYIDSWSSLTTWNYTMPVAGDTVVIPVGRTILMDISPPQLFVLIIQGTLIFDPTKDLTLDASYIAIDMGSLVIGTEDEPFLKNATITLHGIAGMDEISILGAKVLGCYMGTVDMHGKPYWPTWTVLGQVHRHLCYLSISTQYFSFLHSTR